jgi:hypothetical protein
MKWRKMKYNPTNRCLHKLRIEDKLLELTMDERGHFIEHQLTSDQRDCLYCCSGYNKICFNYTPLNDIKSFYQVVKG